MLLVDVLHLSPGLSTWLNSSVALLMSSARLLSVIRSRIITLTLIRSACSRARSKICRVGNCEPLISIIIAYPVVPGLCCCRPLSRSVCCHCCPSQMFSEAVRPIRCVSTPSPPRSLTNPVQCLCLRGQTGKDRFKSQKANSQRHFFMNEQVFRENYLDQKGSRDLFSERE